MSPPVERPISSYAKAAGKMLPTCLSKLLASPDAALKVAKRCPVANIGQVWSNLAQTGRSWSEFGQKTKWKEQAFRIRSTCRQMRPAWSKPGFAECWAKLGHRTNL